MSAFMETYRRTGLIFERGAGCRLFDKEGKSWLDFGSGVGVNALGHGHPALTAAIAMQAERLIHVSNYYQTEQAESLARRLCGAAGMDAVFLCNSGAEACEGALKIARKHGSSLSPRRTKIITLTGSFHGRTIAALAATGQEKFHVHFGPFPEGFVHVPPNDPEALDRAVGEDTAAVMVEPILGEGGVLPLTRDYLQLAERLCAERGALLVADEVQCGMGRTGTFLACDAFGIRPDVVSLAKGLAGGVPVGAVLARGTAASVLGPGDHGSTFGGNPLASAAALAVLDALESPGFLKAVQNKGDIAMREIRSWSHPLVRDVRGRGLMIGVRVLVSPDAVKKACMENGLLVLTAGEDVVRLLPPLVISEDEIREGLAILRAVLDGIAAP